MILSGASFRQNIKTMALMLSVANIMKSSSDSTHITNETNNNPTYIILTESSVDIIDSSETSIINTSADIKPSFEEKETTSTNNLVSVASALANNSDAVASVILSENVQFELDRIYKILIVGNAKCGKSSIISKYTSKNTSFDNKYKTTIGADFVRKDIYVESPVSSTRFGVRLQLWDIAGSCVDSYSYN